MKVALQIIVYELPDTPVVRGLNKGLQKYLGDKFLEACDSLNFEFNNNVCLTLSPPIKMILGLLNTREA